MMRMQAYPININRRCEIAGRNLSKACEDAHDTSVSASASGLKYCVLVRTLMSSENALLKASLSLHLVIAEVLNRT